MPLVVYRLYPRALRIVTAIAFQNLCELQNFVANRWPFCPRLVTATLATVRSWITQKIAAFPCGKSTGCPLQIYGKLVVYHVHQCLLMLTMLSGRARSMCSFRTIMWTYCRTLALIDALPE